MNMNIPTEIKFDENAQKTIQFAMIKLGEIEIDGYKIYSINPDKNEIMLYNPHNPNVIITQKFSTPAPKQEQEQMQPVVPTQMQVPTVVPMDAEKTSDDNLTELGNGMGLSTTSQNSEYKYKSMKGMGGGSKSYQYSATSEQNFVYKKSDGFSETSIIGMNGGNNQLYSETSDIVNLSSNIALDKKMRKMSKKNTTQSSNTSNLNMDIFRKTMMSGGGNAPNPNLSTKMKEYGIKSTSTSSVCE